MNVDVMKDGMRAVLDRAEINDALLRYCRGVDRCDRELIMSAFHSDAVDEHGGGLNAEGEEIAEVLLRHIRTRWLKSLHSISNHLVEIDGDWARNEAHFVRWCLSEVEGSLVANTRWGRSIDDFERRDGDWRIAHRVVVNEWTDVRTTVSNGTDHLHPIGHRSREDLVYRPRHQ